MQATLEKSPKNTEPSSRPPAVADASVLEDKTPEWCRMSAPATGFLLGLGVILVVLFANRPLWHSDLWDHVNYGQNILNTKSVPLTEPLLPLAEGMPMVPTEWLSQVVMAKVLSVSRLGLPALQFGHGLLAIIALAATGIVIAKKGHSVVFAVAGYLVFLAVNWQQFLIIRPQSVGVAFYSILLAVLFTNAIRRTAVWFLLPAMFFVWANSHGSFVMGLALMALIAAGRFWEVLWRTRSLKLAAANSTTIRAMLLLQLCAVAALLNPAGLEIYAEVVRVSNHPNITTMFEWAPLTLRMKQGQITAVACILLVLVLQISPRRLRIEEILVLTVTGTMALWSARMLNWFAPVVAISLGVHGAAAWRAFRHTKLPLQTRKRSGLWTVVSLGLCWIFFGFTSFGTQTIHGKAPELKRLLSRATPIETARFLSQMPQLPPGIAFVPAEWAGYLMNAGPTGFVPIVNLHVHVISPEIWSDYLRLLNGTSDWNGLLDRYGVNLVVVDSKRQAALLQQLRSNNEFSRLYEDEQAVVFERKETVR